MKRLRDILDATCHTLMTRSALTAPGKLATPTNRLRGASAVGLVNLTTAAMAGVRCRLASQTVKHQSTQETYKLVG